MARIRSDKPEAYQSETLAEISVAAERTFKGMATIADDRGRLADKPAQINGELWSMRGSHTTADLEAELAEMVAVDLVCRYAGCDGKRYLHAVTWDQHQKIDRPSKSRLPRCPVHQASGDYCGRHDGDCASPMGTPPPPAFGTVSRGLGDGSRDPEQVETGQPADAGVLASDRAAADTAPDEVQVADVWRNVSDLREHLASRQSREPSMQDLGSRTVDLGSRTVEQRGRARAVPDTPLPVVPHELPDDFEPTGAMLRWANSTYPGLDLDFETGQFRRYWRSEGRKKKSWVDAWQKWIADSHQRKNTRASPASRSQQATEELFDDAMRRAEAREGIT